jgi:hypothetical protein
VHAETYWCGAKDVQCLIAAINAANTNGEENWIRLEAGTYTVMAIDNSTDGPNGLPSITSALRIEGAGADTTSIVRDASAPRFRLLHVGTTGNLTVDGTTLAGGFGGLFNNGGVVDIIQSTVTGNWDWAISNSGGVVNIFRSTVGNNHGSGLANSGSGEVNITQSLFANNRSIGPGGLVTSGTDSTVRIIQSKFSHNNAAFDAGGVAVWGGTLFIANSTFDHNEADGAGAISAFGWPPDQAVTLVVTDSAFGENASHNTATGPGMSLGATTTAIVTNTTFARNNFIGPPSAGGNVTAIQNFGTLVLINSTLADNVQTSGTMSALSSEGDATTILVNTLLARNTGPFSRDCRGSVTSFGNNLIGDPTGCTIDLQPTDLTGDSGLGAFQDNEEPGNGHIPLLATSPAIGAANDDVCPPTDQLGRERTAPCDIGAIAFSDGEDSDGEDSPTAPAAAAVVHTEMSGLVANLAQAVTTLKSTANGNGDLVAQINLVVERAADLGRRGADPR